MSRDDALAEFRRSHWGIEADTIYTVHEPHLPRHLVEMGKLTELHVRIGDASSPLVYLQLPEDDDSQVTYALNTPRRLWLVLSPAMKRSMQELAIKHDLPVANLRDVAAAVGGRQAHYPSPNIRVAVVGPLDYIQYFTWKKDDGPSEYKHRMGEHGGTPPYLCIGAGGRVYLAGGTYDVQSRGIVR